MLSLATSIRNMRSFVLQKKYKSLFFCQLWNVNIKTKSEGHTLMTLSHVE